MCVCVCVGGGGGKGEFRKNEWYCIIMHNIILLCERIDRGNCSEDLMGELVITFINKN